MAVPHPTRSLLPHVDHADHIVALCPVMAPVLVMHPVVVLFPHMERLHPEGLALTGVLAPLVRVLPARWSTHVHSAYPFWR